MLALDRRRRILSDFLAVCLHKKTSLHERLVVEQLAGQHEFTSHITITQQSIGGSLAINCPPLELPGYDALPKVA